MTAAALSATETTAAAPITELPDVEAAIPAPVKALGKPAMMDFPGGLQMAVSATTAEAQAHVNQGLNHLHGGWEFEASRHFAAAMREDPDCLLAHWGMIMALLNPSPETGDARNAATDRLLHLVDQGKGTELERGYAYSLIKYIEEGPSGSATAFRKIAEKFPNDLQAGVFAALFSRGGYDASGDATPDQQTAEQSLLAMRQKNPQSQIPLNALLVIRAEAPDLSGSLDLARQLSQMAPAYAPAQHLLGHYEWRCGNHAAAAAAFSRAASFYQRWMKEQQADVADCPEWPRAECYRIVALVSKGDFENAYTAARKIAATPLPARRPASPGSRFLLWDAKTMPARILIHRGLRGNANEAAHSLPKPDEVKEFRKHSLAYWWMDGLRFALEAQRLIDARDLAGAREVVAALTQHGEAMAKTQSAATASGERSTWIRSFHALELLASDVRGRLALAGPKNNRETAYNWFSAAEDRQHPSPLLLPPMILTPMAARLGDFFLATRKPPEAIEAYQRALTAFPNDMSTLTGLKRAYEAAENPPEAAAVTKQIKDLMAQ
jgi:tetratricopeptide (TPR) repeat protein